MEQVKRLLITALLWILLTKAVAAMPTIQSVELQPFTDLWIGESLNIKVNCTGEYLENVTVSAVGSDGYIIPILKLDEGEGLYTGTISSLYLSRPNNFSATVKCYSTNASATANVNFSVNQFSARIVKISPTEIYLGDQINVTVSVGKNNEPIISEDVKFGIYMNGNEVYPKVRPPYDKGWILFLDSPSAAGTYTLIINASYGRVSQVDSAVLTVMQPVQLSATFDKTYVKPNDTITISLQATDRGKIIQVSKDKLTVRIGGTQAEIISISPVNNYFSVAVKAPNLMPGKYDAVVSLSYANYTYTATNTVYYIVPVTGRITNENGKGLTVGFRFLSNGVKVLELYTDASGSYSGSIPPGTYDLEIAFPQSKLYLRNVEITSFEDPIRYYETSADVPGLNLAGLYVYETTLQYDAATIEMKYDESKILNEEEIKVYRCESWNTGRKSCYGQWEEVYANIDTIRNTVYANTTGLSAYAIGYVKKLSIDYTINKEKFYLKDLVRIKGMVVDDAGSPVSNATVKLLVKGTSYKAYTDSNGLFTFEFVGPAEEGYYTLMLTADKYPYISFETNKSIQVEKSKEVSIVFPDTVRIKQGESISQELLIVNTGQADIEQLNISLSGLPAGYFILPSFASNLSVGEQLKLTLQFSVPSNATPQTLSASLKITADGLVKEKVFGFTLEPVNITANQITGYTPLPEFSWDYVYILLFAVVSFTLAFVLKKRKLEKEKRKEFNRLLFEVKQYFDAKKQEQAGGGQNG